MGSQLSTVTTNYNPGLGLVMQIAMQIIGYYLVIQLIGPKQVGRAFYTAP